MVHRLIYLTVFCLIYQKADWTTKDLFLEIISLPCAQSSSLTCSLLILEIIYLINLNKTPHWCGKQDTEKGKKNLSFFTFF
jgi:hypothetical protein